MAFPNEYPEQLREAEIFSSKEQNIIRYLRKYPETIINFGCP